MDDFTWTVRVRTTGRDGATAYVRAHQFDVGAPLQFDEQYPRVTALEYALAALGADVANGLAERCRRQRVEVEHVEALIGGRLDNPLTFLDVIGEEGHPGLDQITVRVYVGTDAARAEIERIWEETLARSPLVRTLSPAVKLDLDLKIVL
jgi:hypothetical protein